MAEIQWTEAQLEAIMARDCNILVSAAAGSGKTAVLVERVIRMITREEDPLDLDQLIVMTFTKDAAAQMKNKIHKALKDCIHKDPENGHLRKQLMKVQSSRICTIDALCSEIVREHIEDTDLDPAFIIADETDLTAMRQEVLEQLLEKEYEEASENFMNLVEYYTDKNDKKLEEIILKLFGFAQSHPEPEVWLNACRIPYELARTDYAEGMAELPAGMDNWLQEFAAVLEEQFMQIRQMAQEAIYVCRMNHGPAKYEPVFRKIIEFADSLEGQCFDYRVDALVQFLGGWEKLKPIGKNDDVDPGLKDYAAELRKNIRSKLEDIRENFLYDNLPEIFRQTALCADIVSEIINLTIRFRNDFDRAKKDRNLADFSDVAHAALKVLISYDENGKIKRDENDEPIYTRTADLIAGSVREVIVDEYQDTNMLQDYLVDALSAQRFGRPDIFEVGDVKQSIYGFRMACPELFNNKKERYKADNSAGRLINLDSNFRSSREILEFTNRVFSRAMIYEMGRIDYMDGNKLMHGRTEDESLKKAVPEIMFVDAGGDQGKNLEAYLIAGKIEEILAEGQYSLSDIVILTRTTDNPQLEKILYQRGIPVSKSSGKGFFASLEIRLLTDILKVIDNPRQDIELAAVLYSPLVSATADDLARIRLADRDSTLYDALLKYCGIYREQGKEIEGIADGRNENSQTDTRLCWFAGRLSVWREKASYMNAGEIIRYVLSDSGFTHMITAMPGGDDRKANVDFFQSLANEQADGAYLSLYGFMNYIRQLRESDYDFGNMNAASGSPKAVRMMTIHRSKGLEFPVVFLACAGRQYNEVDLNSSVIMNRSLGLGLEYRDPGERMIYKNALMQTIKYRMKVDDRAEQMRLLYVALTRAKDRLIVSGSRSGLGKKTEMWEKESFVYKTKMRMFPRKKMDLAVSAEGNPDREIPEWYRMSTYQVIDNNSFMTLLGQAVFPFMTDMSDGEEITDEAPGAFRFRLRNETEAEEERVEELLNNKEREQLLRQAAEEESDIRDILSQCAFRYPYEKAVHVQGKITASQLERTEEISDRQPEETVHKGKRATTQPEPRSDDKKKYLPAVSGYDEEQEEEFTLKGAERGNAYHRFLELLDYRLTGEAGADGGNEGADRNEKIRESLKEQLEELCGNGLISKEYARTIELDKIVTFLNSKTGQAMKKAFEKGRLFRERQFVMGHETDISKESILTGGDYYSEGPDDELLLVQGIIDAFFVEENDKGEEEITLVDYKTDKSVDEEHYIYKYSPQLNVYADALEKSTGLKVARKLVYSIELGREIEL